MCWTTHIVGVTRGSSVSVHRPQRCPRVASMCGSVSFLVGSNRPSMTGTQLPDLGKSLESAHHVGMSTQGVLCFGCIRYRKHSKVPGRQFGRMRKLGQHGCRAFTMAGFCGTGEMDFRVRLRTAGRPVQTLNTRTLPLPFTKSQRVPRYNSWSNVMIASSSSERTWTESGDWSHRENRPVWFDGGKMEKSTL